MTVGTACGKIILSGEHAVVYGRPALAVPLSQLRARAEIQNRTKHGIVIYALDLGREFELGELSQGEPLAAITQLTLEKLNARADLAISVQSEIPMASGLGSGAAISTAVVRGLAAHFGKTLMPDEISDLVYQTEKMYHGTPSGTDNTVIAYEQPIRFVRNLSGGTNKVTPFSIAKPFTLLIAYTGIASPTKITVGDVRRGWLRDPARYGEIFDTIGDIVREAQEAIASGANERLGELMTRNQRELAKLDVSSEKIETLIAAGIGAGSKGSKLSGGGRGGNVIFYVDEDTADLVRRAVVEAGAVGAIVTTVGN
jgi:mevalonate kinase